MDHPPRVAAALRETFQEGYSLRAFKADLLAGIVVGIVALPLSMALAIAAGVPPQYGLYTAIVAGGLVAILGGSRASVSGPTAAFVVVLAPIASKFGIGGLCVASSMAGIMLMLMGLARMGQLIQFIPYPVTTGFTAGIAVVIATIQVKDALGLTIDHLPEHWTSRLISLFDALPTIQWADTAIAVTTLVILIGWPRINRRVPAPLVALTLATAAGWVLTRTWPDVSLATIGSRFGYLLPDGTTAPGIPRTLPGFAWPWTLPGADGTPIGLSWSLLTDLSGPAMTIALLGAIESLLCAVVADAMIGTRHDPDAELIAQGMGNLVAPLFGGIAATGAIARSATSIRSGGRSPVAAVIHALFVLVSMVALAPLLAHLPMAAMAALLIVVAWNMSEARHFLHMLRTAPGSDTLVLVVCFSLTVMIDMVVAVTVGVVLAALLFMKRMTELTQSRLIIDGKHPNLDLPLPPHVVLYEVAGPLFFGAAEKAMSALASIESRPRAVILYLSAVPSLDVTARIALESTIRKLQQQGATVAIVGLQRQPMSVVRKAGLEPNDKLAICGTLDEAAMFLHLTTTEPHSNDTPPESIAR